MKHQNFKTRTFIFPKYLALEKPVSWTKTIIGKPFKKSSKAATLFSTHPTLPSIFPFSSKIITFQKRKSVYEKRILRSIELSGMLHAKWIVIHVGTALDSTGRYDLKESVHKNICYLKEFVSCAMQNHIGIAIENGTNMEEEVTPSVDELIEITDYYNHVYQTEILGICFDFGHANGKLGYL